MRNEDPVAAKGSSYNRRMKRETQASNDEAFKGLLFQLSNSSGLCLRNLYYDTHIKTHIRQLKSWSGLQTDSGMK